MGAKFEGFVLILIGFSDILVSYCIPRAHYDYGGMSPIYLFAFGTILLIVGIAWAIIGSRYTVEKKEERG
nr:hypothetical protein [uncultured bacterium]